MNKYKVGSNQYQKKIKSPIIGKLDKLIVAGIIIYASLLIIKSVTTYATNLAYDHWLASHTYISTPVVVFAAEISPTLGLIPEKKLEATKANIVAYIMEVFGKYGTHVGVQAIQCFYSESGLRTDAYNHNPEKKDENGNVIRKASEDRGVAQINSVHKYNPQDMHDYRKNIDAAEKVFLRAGKTFNPWYGVLCN